MEQNPWKTPFGRLIIGSAIVAAIVGFSLAAGVMTYFRAAAARDSVNSEAQYPNEASEDVSAPVIADADDALNEASESLNHATTETAATPEYYGERSEAPASGSDETSAAAGEASDQEAADEAGSVSTDNSEDQE